MTKQEWLRHFWPLLGPTVQYQFAEQEANAQGDKICSHGWAESEGCAAGCFEVLDESNCIGCVGLSHRHDCPEWVLPY